MHGLGFSPDTTAKRYTPSSTVWSHSRGPGRGWAGKWEWSRGSMGAGGRLRRRCRRGGSSPVFQEGPGRRRHPRRHSRPVDGRADCQRDPPAHARSGGDRCMRVENGNVVLKDPQDVSHGLAGRLIWSPAGLPWLDENIDSRHLIGRCVVLQAVRRHHRRRGATRWLPQLAGLPLALPLRRHTRALIRPTGQPPPNETGARRRPVSLACLVELRGIEPLTS